MDKQIENIYELKQYAAAGKNPKFIFFWGHHSNKSEIRKQCLSQWYPANFNFDNITYNSAEQFMMAQKAVLFDDKKIFERIIKENQMRVIKELGRKVKNFSEDIWKKNRFEITVNGNMAKFKQNTELKNYLISTKNKILVEASPYDKIWGIGMAENDKEIQNIYRWRGLNLLGFALMKVRKILKD